MSLKLKGLIWIEEIVEKLAEKHDVSQDEVREILTHDPHFQFVEKGHRRGEDVYSAMGQSARGRYLIVFFIHKKDGRVLILSARDMTLAERRRYEKR